MPHSGKPKHGAPLVPGTHGVETSLDQTLVILWTTWEFLGNSGPTQCTGLYFCTRFQWRKEKEYEVSGGVQPWSRLFNNLFVVLLAGLLQNGAWNDLRRSATIILTDHMTAWNYDQYLRLEVCETSTSRIKYRLQKRLFFTEHCRIYGGCWGPEYIYNYFPSGGLLLLKLFGKFELIACRNNICPFKPTVQGSDWLIKCDSHHTAGELSIR